MDAKELMIGDWVSYNDKMSCKITALCKDRPIFDTLLGYQDWSVPYEKLKPISLTPEILEMNRFVCKEIIQTHWISEDGRILLRGDEWLINSNNKWSVHVDNEDMQTIGYFEITYVHELQHALRLCGISKNIEI